MDLDAQHLRLLTVHPFPVAPQSQDVNSPQDVSTATVSDGAPPAPAPAPRRSRASASQKASSVLKQPGTVPGHQGTAAVQDKQMSGMQHALGAHSSMWDDAVSLQLQQHMTQQLVAPEHPDAAEQLVRADDWQQWEHCHSEETGQPSGAHSPADEPFGQRSPSLVEQLPQVQPALPLGPQGHQPQVAAGAGGSAAPAAVSLPDGTGDSTVHAALPGAKNSAAMAALLDAPHVTMEGDPFAPPSKPSKPTQSKGKSGLAACGCLPCPSPCLRPAVM